MSKEELPLNFLNEPQVITSQVWGENVKPLVSISCPVFNHENYIRDAIEGFLMQKTTFPVEIIIHDDASTDGTAVIIEEYQKLYPQLIKPIYQKINQYSLGKSIGSFIREKALGKYIAVCEGDDFWTDASKLQRQVEILENNPGIMLSTHAGKKVDTKSGKLVEKIRPIEYDGVLLAKNIITNHGGYIVTSSYVYRKSLFSDSPDYLSIGPAPDYALHLLAIAKGNIHYIDEYLSVYRTNVSGSYISNYDKLSLDKKIEIEVKRAKMLHAYNEYSNQKFEVYINRKLLSIKFRIHRLNNDLKSMKKEEYKEVYKNLGFGSKIKVHLNYYFPSPLTNWTINKIKSFILNYKVK